MTDIQRKELIVKKHFNRIGALFAAVTMCVLSIPAPAEEIVTNVTTMSGTVTQFDPSSETLIMRSETATSPLTYTVTKKTTVFDDAGVDVMIEKITQGGPVVVYYTRTGDRLIASKIVVKRMPAAVEQRVITVPGTIAQFAPGSEMLILKSAEGADPMRYLITKETVFVDDVGTPVHVEYVRSGDRLLASRVVVQLAPSRRSLYEAKERLEEAHERQEEALEKAEKRLKRERRDRD